MPIKIPNNLPAKEILKNEKVFIMDEERAYHQDIRPLKIAILNLMPTKEVTEAQILRLLSNSSLQVEITLLHPKSHTSKNTSKEHLVTFYKTLMKYKEKKFDGLIITGAPVEQMEFEEVEYWEELTEIMKWSKTNVYFYIAYLLGSTSRTILSLWNSKICLKRKNVWGLFSIG